MDGITELTCPECGERQAQTDECISCGAGLLSLEEDAPVITGGKTTSTPWTSSSSTTTSSPQVTASTKPVFATRSPESPLTTSPETSAQALEKTQVATQASPIADGQPLTIHNETPSIAHSPTSSGDGPSKPGPISSQAFMNVEAPANAVAQTASENRPPEHDPIHSQALLTLEEAESSQESDSNLVAEEGHVDPPPPIALEHERPLSSDRVRYPIFWGNGRSLFGIFIMNSFLTIITLGIYSFWGRVRVRAFLNSQTSFASTRFAYHGTGTELFTGWVKAMLVFGVPYLSISALPYFWQQVPPYIPQSIAGLLFLCFIPVAVVGAHRYRMSRTSLRNIRFSFRGTVSDYTKLWLKGAVLTTLTLGLYYPFFENARRHYLVTQSQFGNHSFGYDGTGKDLFAIYTKSAVLYLMTITLASSITLAVVTVYLSMPLSDMATIMFASSALPFIAGIGLIVPWLYLQAARQCFFWNHTRLGEARFFSTVTAWKIFELRIGHLFLLVSTLGLAWPWVQVRNLQFFYYYTGLDGPLDLHLIEQDARDASPTGEELAGFFDTGFDLG